MTPETLQQLAANAQDLADLRAAVKSEGDAPSLSLAEMQRELACDISDRATPSCANWQSDVDG